MQDFPHHYRVESSAVEEGTVELASQGLQPLASAGPREFGGPGDLWSPETLLVGAVADCFVLTFRAVARASSLRWVALRCEADGVLERIDGKTRFTRIDLEAHLTIPAETESSKAERLLAKAERGCLISNSLACPVELVVHVAHAAD